MLIPALTGAGNERYSSLDRRVVIGLDGSHLAEASITPPLMVRALARKPSIALRELAVRELLAIFVRAADIFAAGEPDGLSAEAFVRNVALSSGLPLAASRKCTLGFFPNALRRMDRFLEVQSPGLDVFDSNMCERGGIRLGMVPRGTNVGFAMPGNHPATHFTWLGALAMKMPVIVRPSMDDPFTPYRLACALIAAGLPAEALRLVPGDHDLIDALVDSCALSVVFGGEQIASRYASNPKVRVHGPGRSKVVVPAGSDFDRAVSLILRLVMDDAGRGCINASAVIVEGSATELAHAVAAALDRVAMLSPLDDGATLGATPPADAAAFRAMIERGLQGGGRALGAGPPGRSEIVDDMTVMRPVVIEVPDRDHPLFGVELPFPFVVFVPVARDDLVAAARNSLAVTVTGNDPHLTRALLLEPSIDKVFTEAALSTEFDPIEPHEGLLFDFLYQKKSFRNGRVKWPLTCD